MLQLRRNRHLWLPRVMDMTQSPEVLILLLPNHVQEMRQKRLCILYWGFCNHVRSQRILLQEDKKTAEVEKQR
mgnify:CR=1 FL=1